jgi:peptidoglycan-N-acetylglucosamine deacetylase
MNKRIILIAFLLFLLACLPARALLRGELTTPLPRYVYANLYNDFITPELERTNKNKIVTLTFDDGPDPVYTCEVLKILRKEQVPATFFMIGKNIEKYPEIVKQVVEQGEIIGNHTYSHTDIELLSEEQLKKELSKTSKLIEKFSGHKPTYFRPPKGRSNFRIDNQIEKLGYRIVLWDETIEHKSARTPLAEANRIVDLTIPGSIVLAHDGCPHSKRLCRKKTVEALPTIINDLKKEGYKFVTLDVLLNSNS